MKPGQSQSVRRRHVIFLSGFDPKGASYYHALYKAEAAKQAVVNAMNLQVGARQRQANRNSIWTVDATVPNAQPCRSEYEFFRWDDIVRKHWSRSIWRLLFEMVSAYVLMLASGELLTVWKLSRKTLAGLVYPLVVLGGGFALVTGLSVGTGVSLQGSGAGWLVSTTAALALWLIGLWCVYKLESRLNTTWLVRIFSFAGKQACGRLPELEALLDAVAGRIAEVIRQDDVDEVLVVGFSVGSILAVSAVARARHMIEQKPREGKAPVLSLLTLGNCIPMLGLFPQAATFRLELGQLAQNEALRWIDFSSPTDWGSFALIDPVDACRVSVAKDLKRNPMMRSPRFHTLFSPDTYARLKQDKRRMHLQYLMAGELLSAYDFFAITAGVATLGERYPET